MKYQKPLLWDELLEDITSVEFLLAIKFAGRDFYFSTRPLVLYDKVDQPIQYRGGLEAKWTDALNLFNESPTLLSIPINLVFPTDISELVSKGHDLWRGTGELSLWIEGRPHEDRVVLINGSLTDPSYGAKGERVKFSLEANGFEDTSLTHTQTQKVNLLTWLDPAEASIDAYYPIVWGTPGIYSLSDGTPATTYGTPVPVGKKSLPNAIGIVAGHEVEATQVTLYNLSMNPVTSVVGNLVTTTDLLDQAVTTVDLGGAGLSYSPEDEIWAIWDIDGGGAWNDKRTAAVSGAGAVIRYLLRTSTLKIDLGTWRSLGTYLDQNFKLSGYINDAISSWKYISNEIIPLLPLSIYSTPEGIGASLWRREALKSDAVGTITIGGGTSRIGPVQYEKQTIINDLRLEFASNAESNKTLRSVGVVGDKEPTESDLFSTEYSRASYLRYGIKSSAIKSDIIYETATAINVLQWKHRASALPYRVIRYQVPIRLGFLRRGDLVLLNDKELFILDYLCFIRDIEWTNGNPILSLVLVDDPPRDSRG